MKTMEDIREFAANGGKALISAEDRLRDLGNRAAENERQLAEAHRNGNVEEYAKLSAEKEALAEMIRKHRDYIAQRPKYATRGDILNAYNGEMERRNAEFRKKAEKYQEEKKRLYELFCELYETRKQMLEDQHSVNWLISDDSSSRLEISPRLKPIENIRMRERPGALLYNNRNTPADVAFFIDSGLLDGSRLDEMNHTFYS